MALRPACCHIPLQPCVCCWNTNNLLSWRPALRQVAHPHAAATDVVIRIIMAVLELFGFFSKAISCLVLLWDHHKSSYQKKNNNNKKIHYVPQSLKIMQMLSFTLSPMYLSDKKEEPFSQNFLKVTAGWCGPTAGWCAAWCWAAHAIGLAAEPPPLWSAGSAQGTHCTPRCDWLLQAFRS